MIDKIPNVDKLKDDDVIFVTGSGGLYGAGVKHIVAKHKLKGKWIWMRTKDCDLTDTKATEAFFKKHKPKYVIHLAGIVGGLFYNMSHKIEFWLKNVAINNNVLVMCDKYKVQKVVSCLSTCVFPYKVEKYPMSEKEQFNGPPHPTNDSYAFAKRIMGVMGKWFKQGGSKTEFVNVIPCNLYGPGDNFHLVHGHVLPSLIHKTYIAKKKGEDLPVWGSGKPLRQFLFSYDAAELLIWSLMNYDDTEEGVIFCDHNCEKSIAYCANLIAKTLDFKGKLVFDTSKSDGIFRKTASNAKLMKLFPGYKFTPMEEGMKQTVNWFLKNIDKFRK